MLILNTSLHYKKCPSNVKPADITSTCTFKVSRLSIYKHHSTIIYVSLDQFFYYYIALL